MKGVANAIFNKPSVTRLAGRAALRTLAGPLSAPSKLPAAAPHMMQMPANSVHPIEAMRELATHGDLAESKQPFIVVDTADIKHKVLLWHALLPRVEPFYAVKCNNDEVMLDALTAYGTGFDCASQAEMEQCLVRGVTPDKIIYAHPCKPVSHLQFARANGVSKMTFDNDQELEKIAQHFPEAELVLRVLVDDSYSVCRFGAKFGASQEATPALLQQAKDLGLNVMGISFHVGSGCKDAVAYELAVERAKKAFDLGKELGHDMKLLDLGGGFPGTPDAPVAFEDIAHHLNIALDKHFPEGCGVQLMAEPGRYMVASAGRLAVNIISRRQVSANEFMYYVNDGVYGSFNCILFDHQHPTPLALFPDRLGKADSTAVSSIWGPTCDSMDCVSKEAVLPKMELGDWILFENMGAYTTAAGSTFNGFPRPQNYYMCDSVDEQLFASLRPRAMQDADSTHAQPAAF